jgi:hypothetical protein
MTRTFAALALLATTLAALPAAADKIKLKGGGTYEGRVIRETEREIRIEVLVSGKALEMTINKDLIASREVSKSPLEKYEAELDKTDRRNADALVGLAVWCQEMKMPSKAAEHLKEALALKPDHPKALKMIQAMGYVKEGKTWMTVAEQKRAQGLELWNGKWLPRDQVLQMRAEREKQFAAAREKAKQERELEIATNAMARLEKEIKALEARLAQADNALKAGDEKAKQIESAWKAAEKKLNEAERRRDSAKNRMRNDSRYNRNNNNRNNNNSSRQYSQAKRDVREAEQAMATIRYQATRLRAELRNIEYDKQELEKRLAGKKTDYEKYKARKDAIVPPPPPPPTPKKPEKKPAKKKK